MRATGSTRSSGRIRAIRLRANRLRRSGAVVAALLCALAAATPALSLRPPIGAEIDPSDPQVQELRDLLGDFIRSPEDMTRAQEAMREDAANDLFHPMQQPPGIQPQSAELRFIIALEAQFDAELRESLLGRGGLLACDRPQVACPAQPANGPAPTEYYVYGGVTAGPFEPADGTNIEVGLAFFDETPIQGGPAAGWPVSAPFEWDFFRDMNGAFVMRSSLGAPFQVHRLAYSPGDPGFSNHPTDARGIYRDGAFLVFVPGPEADGFTMSRTFAFRAENGGNFLPQWSAADTHPDIQLAPEQLGDVPVFLLAVEPSPAPSAPAATPSASAAAGPSGSPSPGVTPGPTATTGPNPLWLVLIGLGGLLVLLGGWLLFSRRRGAADDGILIAAKDPCPDLLAALEKARRDCEEARRAAADARAAQERRAVDERAAREKAHDATRAREAAERELADAEGEPDRGSDSAEDDKRRIDEHDRRIRERAYARAGAQYQQSRAAATDEAGRQQASLDYEQQLRDIADPNGIDKLREEDAADRGRRASEAREGLDQARAAEADAEAAAEAAQAATEAAADAAMQADARAADTCGRVSSAEAAYRDCVKKEETSRAGHRLQFDDSGGKVELDTSGGRRVDIDDTGTKVNDSGPGGTIVPPTPTGGVTSQPRGCPDGTEDWRTEGNRETFIVPVPGAKIQVVSEPSQYALDAWLEDWRSVDADVKPLPAATDDRGIPPTVFVRVDQARINQLWEGVNVKARVITVRITLPLQRIEVQCQRRYVCQNGAWVRTSEKRLQEWDPVPVPREFVNEDDTAIRTDTIYRLWQEAARAWESYLPNDRALEQFRIRCEHGQ